MQFKLRISDKGHIGIFAPTAIGWLPVLIFEDWESYSNFVNSMQSFYNKHHTEVPKVFRDAFGENGKG